MSLFSKILEKLGLRKDKDQSDASKPTTAPAATPPKTTPKATTPSSSAKPAARPPTATAAKPATPSSTSGASAPKQAPAAPVAAPAAPKAISEVDVVKQLEQKAKGTGLNWKQSISDLLFLLEIDNSREARIELAKGTHPAPELTVTANTADVLAVADGKMDPKQALMQGKAKVQGDLTEILDLVKVFMPT